jgi:hypothetical protein
MEIGDQRILLCSPRLLAQVRVETVDPACTALHISAPWEKLGALRPARTAFTGKTTNDRLVLFAGPCPSHHCRVKSFVPSEANLLCRFAGKKWQKLTGNWQTALGVELKKEGILLRGPQWQFPWPLFCKRHRPGLDNVFDGLGIFHSQVNRSLRDHKLNRPSKFRSPAAEIAIRAKSENSREPKLIAYRPNVICKQ